MKLRGLIWIIVAGLASCIIALTALRFTTTPAMVAARPNVDARQALKITVEPFGQQQLGGPIRLHVWLENVWDRPIVVGRCLDGSMTLGRHPAYTIRLFDPDGRQVERLPDRRHCGTMNPLKEGDFFELAPGERRNAFEYLIIFDIPQTTWFRGLRPRVPYKLTVAYEMSDSEQHDKHSEPETAMQILRGRSVLGEVVSEPVTIIFSPEPAVVVSANQKSPLIR